MASSSTWRATASLLLDQLHEVSPLVGSSGLVVGGSSWADRVVDPMIETRHAQVDCFLAKDLALQLLLAHALHQTDQALDLGSNFLVEILLSDDGWLGVGDSVDSDEVVIAPPWMNLFRAAFAV
jgi:hypothetical protein